MYGPNLEAILHRRILISINIKSRFMHDTLVGRCAPVIYDALRRVHSFCGLMAKGAAVGREMAMIASRLRNRYHMLWARVEVLKNYWEKLIGRIEHRSKGLNDKEMDGLLKRIRAIPDEVRETALYHFVQKSSELHAIAFLQWRLKYPKPDNLGLPFSEDRLYHLIDTRLRALYDKQHSTPSNMSQEANQTTKYHSKLPTNFRRNYGTIFLGENTFNIYNLKQIGIPDPFPKEAKNDIDFARPIGPQELVYAETRYSEEQSPKCIFVPNTDTMFKLMRACVSVRDVKSLWFRR